RQDPEADIEPRYQVFPRTGGGAHASRSRSSRSTRPVRKANNTAWTRSRDPVLASTWLTCVLTVGMDSTNSSQISVFVYPRAMAVRISSSRGVRDSRARRVPRAGGAEGPELPPSNRRTRSEEHTSEHQSRGHVV